MVKLSVDAHWRSLRLGITATLLCAAYLVPVGASDSAISAVPPPSGQMPAMPGMGQPAPLPHSSRDVATSNSIAGSAGLALSASREANTSGLAGGAKGSGSVALGGGVGAGSASASGAFGGAIGGAAGKTADEDEDEDEDEEDGPDGIGSSSLSDDGHLRKISSTCSTGTVRNIIEREPGCWEVECIYPPTAGDGGSKTTKRFKPENPKYNPDTDKTPKCKHLKNGRPGWTLLGSSPGGDEPSTGGGARGSIGTSPPSKPASVPTMPGPMLGGSNLPSTPSSPSPLPSDDDDDEDEEKPVPSTPFVSSGGGGSPPSSSPPPFISSGGSATPPSGGSNSTLPPAPKDEECDEEGKPTPSGSSSPSTPPFISSGGSAAPPSGASNSTLPPAPKDEECDEEGKPSTPPFISSGGSATPPSGGSNSTLPPAPKDEECDEEDKPSTPPFISSGGSATPPSGGSGSTLPPAPKDEECDEEDKPTPSGSSSPSTPPFISSGGSATPPSGSSNSTLPPAPKDEECDEEDKPTPSGSSSPSTPPFISSGGSATPPSGGSNSTLPPAPKDEECDEEDEDEDEASPQPPSLSPSTGPTSKGPAPFVSSGGHPSEDSDTCGAKATPQQIQELTDPLHCLTSGSSSSGTADGLLSIAFRTSDLTKLFTKLELTASQYTVFSEGIESLINGGAANMSVSCLSGKTAAGSPAQKQRFALFGGEGGVKTAQEAKAFGASLGAGGGAGSLTEEDVKGMKPGGGQGSGGVAPAGVVPPLGGATGVKHGKADLRKRNNRFHRMRRALWL